MVIALLLASSKLMVTKTPVAFFTYNRPEHTRRALEALSKCKDIAKCDFFFYSDGPRTDDATEKVKLTRLVLHEWSDVFQAQVIERPSNFGLAKSIVDGVSDLCERYGRVIVIEDDLIVSPDFLAFMIQSLNRYEDEPRVMQVAGYTISPPDDISNDAFFLPVTSTWGWATWKRAWQNFAWEPKDLTKAKEDQAWKDLFDLHGAGSFSAMLEDRLAGRNDSWGILWWYAVSRCNGLVVYPSHSLVWNGGFDGSGIHCGSSDFLQQGERLNYLKDKLSSSLFLPFVLEYVPKHLALLEDFLRKQQHNEGSIRRIENTTISKLAALTRQIRKRFRLVTH